MVRLLFGLLALAALRASGHGAMQWPPTWGDSFGRVGVKNLQSCSAVGWGTGSCMVFTNYTFNTGATLAFDSPMRTFAGSDPQGIFVHRNPWMAPGSAKLQSPCGVTGGNIRGCPVDGPKPPASCKIFPYAAGCQCPGGGFPYGQDTLEMYDEGFFGEGALVTKWEAGSVQEAAFGLNANHGGGYAYRLAKVPDSGLYADLAEEDFQNGHLKFAGDQSWVQRSDAASPSNNRTAFTAMRSTEGTFPPGSEWTRDPIPACKENGGGFSTNEADCRSTGMQFEAPLPDVRGYCQVHNRDFTEYTFTCPYTIVDKLQVPAGLEPGRYVLSWRWDCEQTSQVWNTCSDIEIVAPGTRSE